MELGETNLNCQIPSMRNLAEGGAPCPPASSLRKTKLFIRRNMSPKIERSLKNFTNDLLNWLFSLLGKPAKPAAPPVHSASVPLKPGDLVRVRSRAEIESTLNNWRQLKGCAFMPEMAPYCDTTQRVWKRMERFVDERDLRVKRSKGIILLEGVLCQGTAEFGSCDRSCFVFWREEWLEKIQ